MSWRKLPEDVQLEILCLLEPLQLVKARQINQSLRLLVDSSKRTQLVIELARSGYSLACDLDNISSVSTVLETHLAWRKKILNLPTAIQIRYPCDKGVIERLSVFGDRIFVQTNEGTTYSLSIRSFAQSGKEDWIPLKPSGFYIDSIIFADIGKNVLLVEATEQDAASLKLLCITLDTLKRLHRVPEISMESSYNVMVSHEILGLVDDSIGHILRTINWPNGHVIKEVDIGYDFDHVQCPALLSGHVLLFASQKPSGIIITVTDLRNPDSSTSFCLPAITKEFVLSELIWLTEDEQQEQRIFSPMKPHNVCTLTLEMENTKHFLSRTVTLVIKFNDLFRLLSDQDDPHLSWPEWGPKCARFLPTMADSQPEGALSGSRVILPLQEDWNASGAEQSPSRQRSRLSILDFNTSIASIVQDQSLHVITGKLDSEVFSDIFVHPSEAADGMAFIVLGPVPGVRLEPPGTDIHMTESAIVLDHPDQLDLIWLGEPC